MPFKHKIFGKIFAIVLGILIGFQSIIAAIASETSSWSFKTHPQPEIQDLTLAELSVLDRVNWDHYLDLYPICLDSVDTYYEIYQGRYPNFAKQGTPKANFRAWKHHIMSSAYPLYTQCVGRLPYYALLYYEDKIENAHLSFCGRYSGKPKSAIERFFKANVDEMLDFVFNGSRYISFNFFVYSPVPKQMQLNPDVEYYFRKLIENDPDFLPKEWDTSHLIDKLTPERRAFVDAAVKRMDFRAVMETTAKCKPHKQ